MSTSAVLAPQPTTATPGPATAVFANPYSEAAAREIEAWAARTAPAGCRFDEVAAELACSFFPTYLRHTEAEWYGRPFHLQPWQRAVVRATFGWKNADGTRRFREVSIWVPRKNGKTEFAAGLALLLLIADGEYGGQVYSGAVEENQAKIVFNKATTMVQLNDTLARDVDTFKTSLFVKALLAKFEPLSSNPASKHGFSPSGAVYDEIHAWVTGELRDVIHKGTAARRQPLEIDLSTAGLRGHGYGYERFEHVRKVLDGAVDDPGLLPVIFAADPDDDWTDPDTWAKANPNLGVSVKLDYLRAECAKAVASPRLENDFKRYHLNLWTEQVTRWLPMTDWLRCSRDPDDADLWRRLEDELAGRDCYGGLDLAATRDINSLNLTFPPEDLDDPNGIWFMLWRFWLPELAVPRWSTTRSTSVFSARRPGPPTATSTETAMKPDTERRAFAAAELRVVRADDAPPVIQGHAAVFDTLSEPMFGFRERIAPGAFTDTLKSADVRALFNHDPNQVLGRNRAGTLRLHEDPRGLAIEIDPPGTQAARDLLTSMERGDVSQMSFGFRTIEDRWETVDGNDIRTLVKVELFDVSPVTFPAYPDTDVAVRSHEAWRAEQAPPAQPARPNLIAARTREASIP